MDEPLCIICGETRDVKKHYGVSSCFGCKAFFRRSINEGKKYACKKDGKCVINRASRNKCRACRFNKSEKYMKMESTRKQKKEPPNEPTYTELSVLPLDPAQTFLLQASSLTRFQRSINFVDFLLSMNKVCHDNFDPKFENITHEETVELNKIFGRHISLEEGLQHPHYVCPRTKNRYTCERIFDACDITFYWYRTFVMCADYANFIPQFRELSKEDQCQLFRLNFPTFSWCIYVEFIVFDIALLKGYPMGNGSYSPWLSDDIEEFLKKHNTPDKLFQLKKQAMEHYNDFIIKLLESMKSLSLDEKEICLFKVLSLFQQEQQLTSRGMEPQTRYFQFCPKFVYFGFFGPNLLMSNFIPTLSYF